METEVKEATDQEEKEIISGEILYALPEQLGSPESMEEYITDPQDKPSLVYYTGGKIVDYMMLNTMSADCADAFVTDVEKKFHRAGTGSKLNMAYETMTEKLGYTYSQVKTVQTGHYKEHDITNRFYLAMGYKELECFPTLWDEWNSYQIYIKYPGE